MKNGFWWNLGWKNDEYFEFGDGVFKKNNHLKSSEIKSWKATKRWNNVLNSKIIDFKITYIDEACFIPSKIKIEFENQKNITVLIAEELNDDQSIPNSLSYHFAGKIYVLHDENIKTK